MNGQSSLVASQNVNNNNNKQISGFFHNKNDNNDISLITNSNNNNNSHDDDNKEQSIVDERVDLPPSREFVYPKFDAAVFDDDRPLGNLLKAEERSFCQISCKYFQCVQVEVEEHMRRTLTEWMLEVSDAERCDCEVFPLAVSYLDRFLSIEPVHKSQLQVLGTACLFVASKIKQPQPLCAKRLIDYSDKFVNINELMSWELLLLNRLRWDLITVTSGDITDHLLHRLRLPPALEQKLRPQLQIYAALIATEFQLAILPPSIVAVSCLCVGFGRLMGDEDASSRMLFALQPILKVDTFVYEPYVEAVRRFLNSMSSNIGNQSSQNSFENQKSPESSTTGTPTDIRDVDFS